MRLELPQITIHILIHYHIETEKPQCHKSSHAFLLAYLSNSGLADFSGHGFKLRICSQVQLVVPQEL